MRTQKKVDLEKLRVGDELPFLEKPPIDRVQIARYAGAVDDYNPMHLDDELARAEGMPGVFVHAQLPMAFAGQLVGQWLKGGSVTRIAVRFVKLVWPGDRLSFHGRLLRHAIDAEGWPSVDVDLWAENQSGEMVLKGHCCGKLRPPAASKVAETAAAIEAALPAFSEAGEREGGAEKRKA